MPGTFSILKSKIPRFLDLPFWEERWGGGR